MAGGSGRFLVCASVIAAAGLMVPQVANATATSSQAKIKTATHVTASRRSLARDSWVTFTARVSSASGTPTGRVIFTDRSNGSILDIARVRQGKATFKTAALATGSRSIAARYRGSRRFAASRSTALHLTVASAGSLATAYQVNARHDGNQPSGGLRAGVLAKKWSVTLGGTTTAGPAAVSYPIIAGGRVFVTVQNATGYGTKLYALNARTGATEWSVGLGGLYGFSGLTYDGQRLFALNYNGVLTEFVASTGREVWSGQIPAEYAFTAPPTAYDGVVYVTGAGTGGIVYAISEADAFLGWAFKVQNGDKSSPAVDDSGMYVSYACQQDYGFSLGGHAKWHRSGGCEGGGGSTAVLHGSSLYARGAAGDSPIVLQKTSGRSAGIFSGHTAPAFGGTNMYSVQNGDLVATDQSGSPDHWTFGDGTIVTAPVVSGGAVFAGSSDGTVYGVSANGGTKIWSAKAGSVILGPDEQNAVVLVGMAVGGGLLVVPAGNALTAFGD